jgi:hypothetical protein
MIFRGKRDRFVFYIWLAILIPYGGIATLTYYQDATFIGIYAMGSIWIILGMLFYFIIRSTKYTFIDNETLICETMLFFKKKIQISTIRKFEKANGFYAGWKMSTSWNCLVMHYHTYEELLISPENEELFIAEVERRKALINP